MVTQEIKSFADMSTEEFNLYLEVKMNAKFSNQQKIVHKHTDYLEPTGDNSINNTFSGKKVTINGPKFIDEIHEEDHLFALGEIKDIMDGGE